MASPQSLFGFRKYIERGLSTIDVLKLGQTGGKVGFFGTTPVIKPAAATAANTSTLTASNATEVGTAAWTAAEAGVVTNNRTRVNELETISLNTRTRVNEMETKLKALGLLS